MVTICIPIGPSKAYCFGDMARGIFELDYPKDQLHILFSVDTSAGVREVLRKINKFKSHWPYPENITVVKAKCVDNNPKQSDRINWEKRAEFAALLRNTALHYVCDHLPDTSHILFLGSDIVLESHSLRKLLDVNGEMVSGLYVTRLGRHAPLALTWDFVSKFWTLQPVDLLSHEPFQTDWCGFDCVLVSKKIFSQLNWDEYDIRKYNSDDLSTGVGEEGYYYLEARTRYGIKPWIHPDVRPLHINDDGSVYAARRLQQIGIDEVCPKCGCRTPQGKVWKDIETICPECINIFDADPYWEPRQINNVGRGVSIGRPIGMQKE